MSFNETNEMDALFNKNSDEQLKEAQLQSFQVQKKILNENHITCPFKEQSGNDIFE